MARRSKYTEEDKGAAFRSLTLNNGNITRTARELNIPKGTIQTWKAEWERSGPSEEIVAAATEQIEQFIPDATRGRDLALAKWVEKVENDEVAARDLMTGVGVLTDKLNAAKGLTKGDSDKPALDAAALRAIAKGVVEGAVSSALRREEEIVEAEYEEVETPTLKRGTS